MRSPDLCSCSASQVDYSCRYKCRYKLTYDKVVLKEGLLLAWGRTERQICRNQAPAQPPLDKGGLS